LCCDQKVFENRQAREQTDILEGTGDLGFAGDAKVRQALEQVFSAILVAHSDHAHGRLVETGDAIEHGGLAGAVRADQRGDLAALGLEREVVDGHQAAELHRQVLDLEQGIAGHVGFLRAHQP